MKKTILGFLGAICLLSACSKKKDAAPDQQQEATTAVSRLMTATDTTRFIYQPDGSLRQFKQYGEGQGFRPDSTQVLYENGNIARFKMWAFGELRDDRSFQYDTDRRLVRINYYNMVSETETGITDHDSIVYQKGKPTELHVINGVWRNEVYRLTWAGDNITKIDHYLVIQDQEVPSGSTNITYTDKPGLGRSLPGNFLFLLSGSDRDFTALSAKAPLQAETVEPPGTDPVIRITATYTYNENGLPERISNKAETLPGGQPVITVTDIDYITLK